LTKFFSNLLATIIRPVRPLARWLVLAGLIAILTLGYLGYLEPLKRVLDAPGLTFDFETIHISPYRVLQLLTVFVALFWVAALLSDWVSSVIKRLTRLKTSDRALVTQILQIVIYIVLFLVGLSLLGLDLTALTVFSGAVGIGVGFGLQKIASNFISGIILLFEKTVEVDDLIELDDGTAGFIRRISGRFTLLETFDGKDIMIPNEDFITSRVINWTFTNPKGRIEVWIGVAYGSDYELAHQCILNAAREHPRCSDDPEPQCFMRRFGESSVDFVLFFWVDDITTGRWLPQSEVMFAITKKFNENGIVIPFPQRDVHLKDKETSGEKS